MRRAGSHPTGAFNDGARDIHEGNHLCHEDVSRGVEARLCSKIRYRVSEAPVFDQTVRARPTDRSLRIVSSGAQGSQRRAAEAGQRDP